MRWRERGAWWRTLLGIAIAIAVLLVVHLSLLAAGPPPVIHGAWIALSVIILVVGFGAWLVVAVLPAALRSIEERGAELDRRTPGQDTWVVLSWRRGLRLTGYRAARVAVDAAGLTLTFMSGTPIRHPWSAFTEAAVQQRRVLHAWRPTMVLRGPGLSIAAIPWVFGTWARAEEVARQAGVVQSHIAASRGTTAA